MDTVKDDDEDEAHTITNVLASGVEHHLLGLSPQYWAHTRMLNGDIASSSSLELIEGVDCLVGRRLDTDGVSAQQPFLLPVSRCELRGVIVNVERRPNGAILYLLDDGTGLVDCLAWDRDFHSLPELDQGSTGGRHNRFGLGDSVRILGKIRCVAAERDVFVHREVHVTSIEPSAGADAHAVHWLRCVELDRRMDEEQAKKGVSCFRPEHESKHNCSRLLESTGKQDSCLRNGAGVLKLLGDDIAKKVEAGEIAEDWQHFGPSCRCSLLHKEPLLYCHCHATPDPLDPQHTFRDAVLAQLLRMESALPTKTSHLHFCYKDLLNNPSLSKIALETVSGTSKPNVSQRRLFVATFRALRDDGVVFLVDKERDVYLLISRKRVLEPFLRQARDFPPRRFNPPNYFKKVPRSRLKLVSRSLADKQK